MTAVSSRYANILRDHRIVYVPSCLVVEMMTRLYSQVSTIDLSGSVHNMVPDLLVLLRRLTFNIRATAVAYRQDRIKFFIGDWKQDKLRARKLLFNIMSRLGYISELLTSVEKKVLYRAIEEMTVEWTELDEILERRSAGVRGDGEGATCDYGCFRCESLDNWREIMSKIVMQLDAEEFAEYRQPGAYLLLLCYQRIKTVLVKVINEMEKRNGTGRAFAADKILCVSGDEFPLSCPACSLTTDQLRDDSDTAIRRNHEQTRTRTRVHSPKTPQRQAAAVETRRISLRRVAETRKVGLQRRYLMPPSLADIQGRR